MRVVVTKHATTLNASTSRWDTGRPKSVITRDAQVKAARYVSGRSVRTTTKKRRVAMRRVKKRGERIRRVRLVKVAHS